MAISTTLRKLSCIGNGSADTFNFPFKILEKSNFTLILTNVNGEDSVLSVDSDYALTDIGKDSGVIVTYPIDKNQSKLATDEKLTGYRSTEITQPLDFMYGGGFSPRIHENSFDKITMILQEFNEELERRPMLPITSNSIDIHSWLIDIQNNSSAALQRANQSYEETIAVNTLVQNLSNTIAQSQVKVDQIVRFITDISNSLELETGISKFYEIASNLEAKVLELTDKVEELSEALENKVDKDPILELVTSAGVIIADSNNNIIHIPYRKEYYA